MASAGRCGSIDQDVIGELPAQMVSGVLVGKSQALRRVVGEARAVARRGYRSVLVQGESGVGKELVATFLQRASCRRGRPFEVFDCPSIPEDHLESEFFGTARGAFPGSIDRCGVLERADRGTVFLDEIGAMRLFHQAKLLRVMEGKSFRRLGGTRAITCDVAFIAAAHQDLAAMAAAGQFRNDLYFRLIQDGVISIPPLRDRREDIPELVLHCLRSKPGSAGAEEAQEHRIEGGALTMLYDYDWPGNVRQLFSVVQMAVRMASGALAAESVREAIRRTEPRCKPPSRGAISRVRAEAGLERADLSFEAAVRETRRRMLIAAYRRSGGNKTKAGIALGFHLSSGSGAAGERQGGISPSQRSLALRRFRYWACRLELTLKGLLA